MHTAHTLVFKLLGATEVFLLSGTKYCTRWGWNLAWTSRPFLHSKLHPIDARMGAWRPEHWIFFAISEYKRLAEAYPCEIFYEILRICGQAGALLTAMGDQKFDIFVFFVHQGFE